jgi:hypothetical protein
MLEAHGTRFGHQWRRSLTLCSCPWRGGSVAGERRWQAGGEVAGAGGEIDEQLDVGGRL